jgi:hypothetical protein
MGVRNVGHSLAKRSGAYINLSGMEIALREARYKSFVLFFFSVSRKKKC